MPLVAIGLEEAQTRRNVVTELIQDESGIWYQLSYFTAQFAELLVI